MNIIRWISDNILFIITLFLLAFIPLYPKLPIIGVEHTWVYVRLEDFLVAIAIILWIIQIFRKKATFKTPLTIPIIIFWIVGGISTFWAIYFIFPHIANVFPNVALFSYLRRIEYLSLFFIAFSAIRSKRYTPYIVSILVITMLVVVAYGIGQRLYGFPAFLTGNEEFAKGIPLRISSLGRIPSTFAGHYDLAAYLVMLIAVIGSMVFGFKNWFVRIGLFLTTLSGLILLLMTASRVSFAVYLVTIAFMLILQKRKVFIIPVFILSFILLNSFQGISNRYGSTISSVDVVVDARTGKVIGIAKKTIEPSKKTLAKVPVKQQVVVEEIESTGENLPQGTSYINLPGEPTEKTITQFLYKRSRIVAGTESAQVTNIEGEFIVKKVLAYDVSFTTRFQGEWPRAIEAFKRNIFLGSGYSSISLATDNNYLRILGEVGIFGFGAFLLIFIIIGIYIFKVITNVKSQSAKSLILGVVAGLFGLGLNAILIDVFEASKVAFVMWLLLGIALGTLYLYKKRSINYLRELKVVLLSTPSILIYLFLATLGVFSIIINNHFVGDDFTWFRWVADCKKAIYASGDIKCEPLKTTILHYFTESDGFFYRPGTKLYSFVMYSLFWLNPIFYHLASILIHFVVVGATFIISLKILKSGIFAFIVALFFLVLSGHSEAILWFSSTGHLITAAFILLTLIFYIKWREEKRWVYLPLSILMAIFAPLFQESGIVAPLFIFAYDFLILGGSLFRGFKNRWQYYLLVLPIPFYLFIRKFANSLGPSGDYSYNFIHLPYNFFGNIVGYIGLSLFGTKTLFYYENIRIYGKTHILFASFGLVLILIGTIFLYRFFRKKIQVKDLRVIFVGIAIFIIALLPFLGLGNIALRYVYLASFGIMLLFVFILQKLYLTFRKRSRIFATFLLVLIIFVFTAFHMLELQRVNKDWKIAGEISNRLLINFNNKFQAAKTTPPNPVFYFVDTPIRYGEAWVFPVGLPDALWFTFQKENLKVHNVKSLDLALDYAEGSLSARVFQFDKKGNVEEVVRTKKTIIVPIDKK